MIMRPRPAARRTDIEKSSELFVGLFAVEQHDYCLPKRVQRAAKARSRISLAPTVRASIGSSRSSTKVIGLENR